ncbi:MAG: D-glycerate dehydrogenase [Actinobacteria bacterium]|nr:D-glycerate dehydrogenase [Actinomycetota bacterium]
MARVLVTRRLPGGGTDPLVDAGHEIVGPEADDRPLAHDELMAAAAHVDAIVCLLTDRVDDAVLHAGSPRLRVVANVAVGYDNIDVAAAAEVGVVVCNTPGVLDETTADTAFLLMLAASRLATEAEDDLRAGRWRGWNINDYLGLDVHGRVLGVVGWGRIGRAVGRRAAGFGMTVLHHSRRPTGDDGYVADLDELLRRADVVSLHVPLQDSTRHLIDARRLALIGPHGVLVNTARGPVVDSAALHEALRDGVIWAAALDVTDPEPIPPNDPLVRHERCLIVPHIASASRATRAKMAEMAAANLLAGLRGEPLPTPVNPDVYARR